MKITICFRLILVLVLIITLGGKPVYAQNTQDWSITGNAGTDPVTNFLGTTDNQSLEIRVNNERVLRLEDKAVSPNLIGGIQENTVTPGVEGATIGGGGRRQGDFNLDPNRVTGDFGTVAGGQGNRAGDDKGNLGLVGATVSGGSQNTANGNHATVGGGSGNVAGTNPIPRSDDDLGGGWSTISGGLRNVAADEYTSVGGGEYNCALAQYATIAGGGRSNQDDRSSSNRVTDNYGTVGGGGNNQAGNGTLNPDAPDWCLGRNSGISTDSIYATVGGGRDNTASGFGNTVGGGIGNTASGIEATVSGGLNHRASGIFSTIAGGAINTANGNDATVGGGTNNTASGDRATVSGGRDNTASGTDATVSGGRDNTASGDTATVNGGRDNNASGILSTIAGGSFSNANEFSSTIAGGTGNTANGTFTTIGGGISNTASGVLSTIAGGAINTARGDGATISGGTNHNASGTNATVGGGIGNNASGIEATVSGGSNNTASGTDATIPGGTRNTAAGSFSFAAGHRARANNPGSFVWGDSTDRAIGSNRNNQFTARASGGVRFFSNSGATVGVQLAPGAGSWSSLSSQNAKTNFAPVDGQSILSRLAAVPIQTWNYKSQDPSIRHIGSMAEDLYKAFGVGEDNKYINTVDANGIALASIQGLYQIVQEKDDQIAIQQQKIASLEVAIKRLEKAINKKS